MKAISRDQATEIGARFLTDTSWGSIEHDTLQAAIDLPRDELGRRFTAFMQNGCRFVVKGPGLLIVDRSKPFDPVKFIGSGWTVVEGDSRNSGLTEVDFSKVRFESGLKEGETTIDGDRYFLYLYRKDDGSWNWNYNWLDNDRNHDNVSPLLATLFLSPPSAWLFGGVLLVQLPLPAAEHLAGFVHWH